MDQSYWEVDDILAESQRLPCTFNIGVPGLGYLEGSGETDIEKHARVELPYWMAELLAVYDIVTIQQPRAFGTRVRAALDATATSVQLRNMVPQWYALALRLAQLLGSDEMRNMLARVRLSPICATDPETYMARLPSVYEQAVLLSRGAPSAGGDAGHESAGRITVEMQDFLQGLDDSERCRTWYAVQLS